MALARRDGPGARLGVSPTELIDRSRTVAFDFDGRTVEGYEGDTIASALYASGVRIFSRSFKYHRPRGLLCAASNCANCLMTVDGVPNVRTCAEPARSGLSVRGQNAWPSVERDALSVLDKLGALMPVGFYYKTFHSPKFLWKMAQPFIRRVAGLGSLDTAPARTSRSTWSSPNRARTYTQWVTGCSLPRRPSMTTRVRTRWRMTVRQKALVKDKANVSWNTGGDTRRKCKARTPAVKSAVLLGLVLTRDMLAAPKRKKTCRTERSVTAAAERSRPAAGTKASFQDAAARRLSSGTSTQ